MQSDTDRTGAEDGTNESISNSEAQLPAKLEQILERLPPEDRREAEFVMHQIVTRRSGIVPDSEEMAGYKSIDLSFPERFMVMAESQVSHRHKLETTIVDSDFKLKRRGQDYALFATIFGLLIAFAFAMIGQSVVAGIVAGTTVVGVAVAFITARVTDAKSQDGGDDE